MAEPDTILIVDDEIGVVEMLSDLLQLAGYRVLSATRGARALDLVKENKIALIISDYKMPEMSGLELCQRLRSSGERIPFVLLSGYLAGELRALCIDAGVNEIIEKPVDGKTLREAVKRLLNQQDQ